MWDFQLLVCLVVYISTYIYCITVIQIWRNYYADWEE